MDSGKKHETQLDLLTSWELMAINVLLAAEPQADFDVNAVQANMLAMIEKLDGGELDPALADKVSCRRRKRCCSPCCMVTGSK